MLLSREGRFRGRGVSFKCGENKNRLATVEFELAVDGEYLDGEWAPVEADTNITCWSYLEKRDGAVNTDTVDQLKRAFGWDGKDMFWFEDTDLGEKVVQFDVKRDDWQGKEKYKVAWLHAADSDPDKRSKAKSTDTERRALSARLGSKLRALAGPAPSVAPSVPKPAPTPTPADIAWDAFKAKCPADATDKQCELQWFTVLELLFPGVRAETLTPEQWEKFKAECGNHIVPF